MWAKGCKFNVPGQSRQLVSGTSEYCDDHCMLWDSCLISIISERNVIIPAPDLVFMQTSLSRSRRVQLISLVGYQLIYYINYRNKLKHKTFYYFFRQVLPLMPPPTGP